MVPLRFHVLTLLSSIAYVDEDWIMVLSSIVVEILDAVKDRGAQLRFQFQRYRERVDGEEEKMRDGGFGGERKSCSEMTSW